MLASHRHITALLLSIIYLLIVCTPLAPFAMQSKLIVHAVTGECTGDCGIDGCSHERCANHTCCCWQKKQRALQNANPYSDGDVCDAHPKPLAEESGKDSHCFAAKNCTTHENSGDSKSASASASQKKRTTFITSCPCGSGKLFALLNVETTSHLPFLFTDEIPSPGQSTLVITPPDRLASRYGEPPEPPPIIMIIS